MTTQSLNPNADRSGSGDFTITGSASTISIALSDASDATYVTRTSGAETKSFVIDLSSYSLGADEAIESVRIDVRMARPDAGSKLFVRQGYVTDPAAGTVRYGTADQYSGSVALQTLTGAERIVAPDGLAWDQDRLDNLVVKVTDYASASAARTGVYKVQAIATINDRPSASVTSPSGSVTDTSRPAIAWTYSDVDGDPQSVYQVKVFTAAQYGAADFDPDTSTPEWGTALVDSADPGVTPGIDLETGTTYRAYVQVGHALGTGNFLSNWTYAQFTMAYAAQATPQLDVAYEPTINGVYVTATGRTNYLTDDDSVFTASIGSWQAVSGCNITRSTGTVLIGPGSLQLDATSTATMKARTGLYAVATDGQNVSGIASFRADAVGRTCRVSLYWYDSSASLISTTDGATITDVFTGWTTASVTAVPPVNTASAAIGVEVQSPASGEDHFVDKVALHPGTIPVWGPGGFYDNQTILVQRSIDNGVTWEEISQFTADTPSQVAQSDDYTAPRDATSVYRARTVGVSSTREVLSSAWSGNAAAYVTNDGQWWLKALGTPALNIGGLRVRGPLQESVQQSVGVFRPLGRSTPVVVSGDIYGNDGQYSITFVNDAEWGAAQDLLFSFTGDILVQDPFGEQKTIRFISRAVDRSGTVANPVRVVTVGYVEVS